MGRFSYALDFFDDFAHALVVVSLAFGDEGHTLATRLLDLFILFITLIEFGDPLVELRCRHLSILFALFFAARCVYHLNSHHTVVVVVVRRSHILLLFFFFFTVLYYLIVTCLLLN